MTGFREQGSGIPLMLLHGISSGAASAQADGAERFSRAGVGHARLRRKPDAGRSAGKRGDYADALAAMLDRAGVWCWSAIPGRWWPAPLRQSSRIASFIWCWPTRRRGTAMPRRSSGSRSGTTASSRWRWGRNPRPDPRPAAPRARAEDIATVAAGMRVLRPEGYLAASWMLAHDDIHGWLKRYSGSFEVWCGEQDAITQPELVQGLALRYGMPFITIPQAGHASYLDNDAFSTNSFYALTKRCAMNAQIDGRVAVVTGGSSGIGFETLRLLLGEGAKVAFCGRDADRLASAHATLQNEFPHGEIFAYRCDVLNADEVQAFADAVQARFGAADMLINNAGRATWRTSMTRRARRGCTKPNSNCSG